MIVVKLMGGLGNQLFQYALGRHLSILNDCELILDTSSLKYKGNKPNPNFTDREYQLSNFNINARVADEKLLKKLSNRPTGLNRLFQKKYTKVFEKGNQFQSEILSLKKKSIIEGYWQSEKYFWNIKDVLIKDLTLKNTSSYENIEVAKKISESNAVSLHVRRGDYISNSLFSEVIGACSLDYYKNAINKIITEIENPTFFVFSDDIAWVKDNFGFITYKIIYVENNNELNCYEDIRLMSLCKHNIIANSSFSWWGAWLNSNKEKIVVAPQKWFNDSRITNPDLIPENWIKL